MIKISKKYQIIGAIILVVIAFTLDQLISSKKIITSVETAPFATPSGKIITPSIDYIEASPNWNAQIQNDLKTYKKSDKARIDQTLSVVRLNSPITQSDFTIEYSYGTATYTITLKQPADNSQKEALAWLRDLGISSDDLKTLKVNWVTAP